MTTKILVDQARERYNHSESRLYLKEKYQNQLRVTHAGGMWTVTPALISFLNHQMTEDDTVILIDDYEKPIQVVRTELLAAVTGAYNSVMAKWRDEYTELSSKR